MVWVQGTGTHYTESTPGRYLSEPQGRSYRVTIVTMPPAGLPRLNKHELCWTISGLHLTKYMGHCTACTAIGQAKMFRTNSSMKGPLLVHRVLGAGAEIHFYPSKAWIPFINAPVCSVNEHPGEKPH